MSKSENPEDWELIEPLERMYDSASKTYNNPHLKAWAKIKARTNYQKANCRTELFNALVAAGHEVVDTCNAHNTIKDEFKNMSNFISNTVQLKIESDFGWTGRLIPSFRLFELTENSFNSAA